MKLAEYVRRYDMLPMESTISRVPARKDYQDLLLKEIGRGKRVLDLGCLGGQFSKKIKDQNNDVYGVELNSRAVAKAQEKGIRVKQFDLNEGIPFEDGLFDLVNAGEVIGSLYDTRFLFEECHRVLKPQGIFLFSTQNLASISNRLRLLSGLYPHGLGAFPEDHDGDCIRAFNLSKIREICRHSGFQIDHAIGMVRPGQKAHQARFNRVLRPLYRLLPQFGDLFIVRAERD